MEHLRVSHSLGINGGGGGGGVGSVQSKRLGRGGWNLSVDKPSEWFSKQNYGAAMKIKTM